MIYVFFHIMLLFHMTYFANCHLCVEEPLIKYSQEVETHRILIENGLKNIFKMQIPEGQVSPLIGGNSGDYLYVVEFNTGKLVFRIISSEAHSHEWLKQYTYSEIAAQNAIGPAILYKNRKDKIFVTEFIEGEPLVPSILENSNVLSQLSHALYCLHHADISLKNEYDIFEVLELKLNHLIQENVCLSENLKKYLCNIRQIRSAIHKRNLPLRPCHNDLHTGNVFYDENQKIKLIDWGDAGLSDPFYELARASVEFHLTDPQIQLFLKEYFGHQIALIDQAHFFLMRHIVMLKIALCYLELDSIDASTKDALEAYFKEHHLVVSQINHPLDAAKIIFSLFESGVSSEEFTDALLAFQQLEPFSSTLKTKDG